MGPRSTVTVTEAKTQLSRLIERVSDGEEIVIRRGPKPVARLVRYASPPGTRKLGALEGELRIKDDFDAPDDDLERLFGTRA